MTQLFKLLFTFVAAIFSILLVIHKPEQLPENELYIVYPFELESGTMSVIRNVLRDLDGNYCVNDECDSSQDQTAQLEESYIDDHEVSAQLSSQQSIPVFTGIMHSGLLKHQCHHILLARSESASESAKESVSELGCSQDQLALITAVQNGDYESATQLLKHVSPNMEMLFHLDMPLNSAVYINHLKMIELLLEKGAKVNSADRDGITALHDAARYGTVETAKLLITHGAEVNQKTQNGITPLHYAVQSDNTEMVRLFIEHGATVLVTDTFGTIPLDYLSTENVALVNLLRAAAEIEMSKLEEMCTWRLQVR